MFFVSSDSGDVSCHPRSRKIILKVRERFVRWSWVMVTFPFGSYSSSRFVVEFDGVC